jgi:hypothetical protein
MKTFSEKKGEIAAAIFAEIPKKLQYLKTDEKYSQDKWLKNRLDWISKYNIERNLSVWG